MDVTISDETLVLTITELKWQRLTLPVFWKMHLH